MIRLLAFGVIAVVAVLYVGGNYAGLDRLVGPRGYVVTAQFEDSGGIFTGAEVTYRGVTVGEVAALHLTDDGVDVELDISDGTPKIPADTTATVTNRSAVGEQYVDLRPERDGGPYLEHGSVIEQESTDVPIRPDTLLMSLDRLLSSVNTDSLRTVVDESYLAFADSGPQLQRLLDTASSFAVTARENAPDIEGLLSTSRTVLETQRKNDDDLATFASGLKTVSEQFAESDSDLRAVIDRVPEVGKLTSDFLETSGSHLSVLIANLLSTATTVSPRDDALEQLMTSFPVVAAFAPTVSMDGRGQLGLVFDNFNPPSCTKGYEGTKQRPADDTSEVEPNKEAYCAEPPGSPITVRGSQNSPYGGRPTVVEPPAEQEDSGDGKGESLPGLLDLPSGKAGPDGIAGLLGG